MPDTLTLPPPPVPGPVLVGFSGGLDSTVLLHLLAGDAGWRDRGLRALHVHHGLQPGADAWEAHCRRTCEALGIALDVARVAVDRDSGLGLEAAARGARYEAFQAALPAGGILALGHHQDDQAETFLLHALRGSGVEGLRGIPAWRPLGAGWLWRPLLAYGRERLLAWARTRRLEWIEDPSNASAGHDRNHLRLRVLPLLRERWPHAGQALARSAALAGEAAGLLAAGDRDALAAAGSDDPQAIDLTRLLEHPAPRRARVLRLWLETLGMPPLPAGGVARIEAELLPARGDAEAEFAWAGARVRRWRGLLHASRGSTRLPGDFHAAWDGRSPLRLPTGDTLAIDPAPGDRAGMPPWPLRVHPRRGGERMVLAGRAHSHALKQLLQERGVPPWVRERLPLLSSADGTVVAAGDLVLGAAMEDWLRRTGTRLRWKRAPAGG